MTRRNHVPGGVDITVEEPAPRTLLVQVTGELGTGGTSTLDGLLGVHLCDPAPTRVVVDLTRVTLLAPPALDLLRRLRHRCRRQGIRLVLVGTSQRAVSRPLLGAGLLGLFDTRPTVASALRGPA